MAACLKKRLVLSVWLERFTHFKSVSAMGGECGPFGVRGLEGLRAVKEQWGMGWRGGVGLLAEERWSCWRGGRCAEPQPLWEGHLHGVDCDGERRVVPIHLGLLGSLRLPREVLMGDPDPVHAHGHDKHQHAHGHEDDHCGDAWGHCNEEGIHRTWRTSSLLGWSMNETSLHSSNLPSHFPAVGLWVSTLLCLSGFHVHHLFDGLHNSYLMGGCEEQMK